MKRVLLLLCCVFSLGEMIMAQDIVTLRNGNVFKAKVISIEGDRIKYNDYGTENVEEKVMFSRDVYSIQFENGMTQVFEQQSSQSRSINSDEKKKQTSGKMSTWKNDSFSSIFFEFNLGAHFGDVFGIRAVGEIGKSFDEYPIFAMLGIGYGFAFMGDYCSRTIRIPAEIGYFIGDNNKGHMDIRGGIGWNFLTGMDYKGNDIDLSGYDRSSWNGSVRVSIGYRKVNIFGQYDFSFQSNGGGNWFFGVYSQLMIENSVH